MKPTCIAYTNTNEYNIQTCGFHQPFKKNFDEKYKTLSPLQKVKFNNFEICKIMNLNIKP